MKVCSSLLFAIVLTSCSGVSQPTKATEAIKAWQTKIVRRQKHIYTQSGLLDTTYRFEEYYVNGQVGSKMDFLILRDYDNKNNLKKEKVFQLVGKKKIISEETLFEYDTKNNLILKRNIFQNVLSELSTFKFNDLGQMVEEMKIQKLPDLFPEDWTMDSVLAHHSDKVIHHYDTLTIDYKYNSNGSLTEQVHKNSERKIDKIVTLFIKNEKSLTLEINSKGDTVSITRYQKDNNLTIELRNDKMNKLFSDTTIYDGNKKLQSVSLNRIVNYRHKETFKYDEKGSEIKYMSFD